MTEISKELLQEPTFHQEDLLLMVQNAVKAYNEVHGTTFSLKHVDLTYTEPEEVPFEDDDDVYCPDCGMEAFECQCGMDDIDNEQMAQVAMDEFSRGYEAGVNDALPDQPDYFSVGIETADPDIVAQAIMLLAPLGLAILTKPVFGDEVEF